MRLFRKLLRLTISRCSIVPSSRIGAAFIALSLGSPEDRVASSSLRSPSSDKKVLLTKAIQLQPTKRTRSPLAPTCGEPLHIFVSLALFRPAKPPSNPISCHCQAKNATAALCRGSRITLPFTHRHSGSLFFCLWYKSCQFLSLHLNPPLHFLISYASLSKSGPGCSPFHFLATICVSFSKQRFNFSSRPQTAVR